MENKLGLVFSSDNLLVRYDKNKEKYYINTKREYICYLGEAEIFKKHLFDMAIRNGYGSYRNCAYK
jgi:hypothetical protein